MRIMGMWFDGFTYGFIYLLAMALIFCLCAEMYYDDNRDFSMGTIILTGMFGSAIFSLFFMYLVITL